MDYEVISRFDNYIVCRTEDGSISEDVDVPDGIKAITMVNYLRMPEDFIKSKKMCAELFDYYYSKDHKHKDLKHIINVTRIIRKYSDDYKSLKRKYDQLVNEKYSIKQNILNIFTSVRIKLKKLNKSR